MFEFFRFSLPRAVTDQLIGRLDQLAASPLTDEALRRLIEFQTEHESARGVYVVFQAGAAVYAGKADRLAERLNDHLCKLRGRRGIDLVTIEFKALVLDENWSTSANEDLLIAHFKARGECQWNGSGFGLNDPGKRRDGGEPNWFDSTYPVREDFLVEGIADRTNVTTLLEALKRRSPYLFRYDVGIDAGQTILDLVGVPRNVRDLALHVAQTLGAGWQLMLFHNGFTLYHANRPYEHGQQLYP